MGNIRKNIANLLRKTAIVSSIAVPLAFAGCEKEPPIEPPKDTTAPKIEILSPKNGATYYNYYEYGTMLLPIKWKIKDENGDFKNGWYSVNNGVKVQLPSKSGSIDRYCFKKHNNILVIGAEDIHSNASKDSSEFYVGDLFFK